jgi:hypothetical protein
MRLPVALVVFFKVEAVMSATNYSDFVTSRVKWLGTPQLNLVHSGMGLLGEAIEFSEAHLPSHKMEELGDLEFYFEHARQTVAQFYDGDPHSVIRDEFRDLERDPQHWIIHWCAEYHDYAKKAFIYGKPLAELDFMGCLVRIQLCLYFLSSKLRTTRTDVQEENMAKLEKRYPMGYTDAAAQARADKVEA